ncbi:MAG: RNA polymerase sporulation sigma factor SigK [Firmicutes bacterium]|nr:RNA polymerase sporulation sigma factor SigK [Bacillota bacterium]
MAPLPIVVLALSLARGLIILVSYVTSSNAFPLPFSEKEELRCLQRLEQGDKIARDLLVERNLRLVAHIVKKFDNTGEDIDDLISIGTVGLIKAIDTFDRKQGTRLATYAARCIENQILMFLRSSKRIKREVSLYEPIGVDKEGNEINLMEILGTDADAVPELIEIKFERERLLEKVGRLGSRERRVVEYRYGLRDGIKKTQREISQILGISRSYVSRIEKRALAKLGRELALDEVSM